MTNTHSAPAFSGRALTSMLTTGGFLVMGATGLMLYATPEGRLAYWVDWTMAGLTKEEWGAIHVTSSFLFLGAGFVHLGFNWRQFVAYLRRRIESRARPRPEAPAALALLGVLVAGTLAGWPPFTYVMDFSAYLKAGWSVDASLEPPFGHAEEATLKTLALRTATDASALVAAIADAGFKVEGPGETMRHVADVNGVSPSVVWVEVTRRIPSVRPEPLAATETWSPESVETRFEGAGFGAKSLAETATALGLDATTLRDRLAAAGIAASEGDRLRALATDAGTTPTELLKVMLIPGYRLPTAP
jgi:hypothetical protein